MVAGLSSIRQSALLDGWVRGIVCASRRSSLSDGGFWAAVGLLGSLPPSSAARLSGRSSLATVRGTRLPVFPKVWQSRCSGLAVVCLLGSLSPPHSGRLAPRRRVGASHYVSRLGVCPCDCTETGPVSVSLSGPALRIVGVGLFLGHPGARLQQTVGWRGSVPSRQSLRS